MDNAKIMAEDKGDYAIAFTQTYTPKLFMHKNPTHNRQFRESWNDIEYELSKCGNAYVVPEFTLNGIIHYHGMLEVKDKYQYQKMIYRMKRDYGYNVFKNIDNRPKWEAYILKDIRETEKLCRLTEGSLPLKVAHGKSGHTDIRKIDDNIKIIDEEEKEYDIGTADAITQKGIETFRVYIKPDLKRGLAKSIKATVGQPN